MIFVTVGSQKFQFDRLLQCLDQLIEKGIIRDDVMAQIGVSQYVPKHFRYVPFMDREEFSRQVDACTVLITHGGTGAIIGAVKKGKKVIAVPRLSQYGEHVDDHQLQLIHQFDDLNLICPCYDLEDLGKCCERIGEMQFRPYLSNTHRIIESIDSYLSGLGK